MAVELILLEGVSHLGSIGDKVKVADGYARNYLLPRNLATPVTKQALQQIEAKKTRMQQEYEASLSELKELAAKIQDLSVTIPMEANEQERLYGAVTSQQVVDTLAKEHGIKIDRQSVALENPIRELGVFEVPIRLASEVETSLKVWVVKA